MSITPGSTRRWPNFKTEQRRALAIELMASGRTITDEYNSRVDHYKSLGVTSSEDLASAITPTGNKLWGYLTKYHKEVQPIRERAIQALQNNELDEASRDRLAKLIQIADDLRSKMEGEGLRFDDSITYRRLSRGQRRANLSAINQLTSGFDDILADNEFLLTELELQNIDD